LSDLRETAPSERLTELTADELAGLVEKVERRAHRMLLEHAELLRLSSALRGVWDELNYPSKVDATLEFLRSTEALVTAALDPKAARSFSDSVAELVARR